MEVERFKLLTEFLILSGFRIGEVIALNDSDVDLDEREINVDKTCDPRTHVCGSTKTETSCRTVYMQDELYECCKRIKQFVRLEQVKYGYRSDIFIPRQNGSYLCYCSYYDYFGRNTEKLLGRRLTPHSLRHTHTALMAEAGVPLEAISRRLGHANSQITREVYLHVTKKMKEKERKMLRDIRLISK
jgi:integrase